MNLLKIIKDEVKAAFDQIPVDVSSSKRKTEKMKKEMDKIVRDFSKFKKIGIYNLDYKNETTLFNKAREAQHFFELALYDFDSFQQLNKEKNTNTNRTGRILDDALYNYNHGLKAYNKAKQLYPKADINKI